jgi:hypothetical protein
VNISGLNGNSGGVIYSTGNTVFEINSTTFTNVSVTFNGGAIKDEYTASHSIQNSTFQNCISASGVGGAIYKNGGTLPSIINCRFISNSADGGGHDIAHNSDSFYNSYTASTLSGTCSSSDNSESPRIYFPNGSNLDNLLIGFKFIYFFFKRTHFFLFFFFLKKKNVIQICCM